MASLMRGMVILIIGLLTIQTAPSVRAQHRMGMMMGRQMMMNGGMAQGLNSNLIGNSFASRRFGFGRYGGGVYADLYAPAYSYEDNSNSKQKKRKYRIEEPTLSPEEERERLHQIELAWSRGEMNEFESQTATALNILLADLYDLQSKGIQAPDMTLDTESLGRLNVLAGRTNGNPGLLRNHGQLDWPIVLQRPEFQAERELISRLAPRVIEQARHGQATDLAQFTDAVKKLHQNLLAKIAGIPTPAYIRANRFLMQLDDAIKILRQPDAGNYFNETYAVRGNTVRELVRHMTRLDLHFAPPLEGDAPAYHALHQVLAACDRAAHEQTMARK
jgi:hypothetical protein